MDHSIPVIQIAQLIQLAIAPVFLLAGIGALLNVVAHRLARVVDRSRVLEREFESYDEEQRARAGAELSLLDRRMQAANYAISACTASALFTCLLVAILFVADFSELAFGQAIALLFVATMGLLIAGLVFFLYEIRLAMRSLRVRSELLPRAPPPR
jgi:type IV secretory pathway VirB6-like protein